MTKHEIGTWDSVCCGDWSLSTWFQNLTQAFNPDRSIVTFSLPRYPLSAYLAERLLLSSLFRATSVKAFFFVWDDCTCCSAASPLQEHNVAISMRMCSLYHVLNILNVVISLPQNITYPYRLISAAVTSSAAQILMAHDALRRTSSLLLDNNLTRCSMPPLSRNLSDRETEI